MRKLWFLIALLAAFSLVAAACGSDDDDGDSASDDSSEAADDEAADDEAADDEAADDEAADDEAADDEAAEDGDNVELAQGENLTFYVITHSDGGVFWSVVQKSVEDAGIDLGVNVIFQGSDNDPQVQSDMIAAAITEEPDGIAVSLPNPSAVESEITNTVNAGIPVYSLNSGSEVFKDLGIVTHVGQTEVIAGNGAGERLADAGGTAGLCIIQEQGNIALENRCAGMAETFGGPVTNLIVSGDADPETSESEILSALQADEAIDVVLAAGPVQALLAANAIAELDRDIQMGGFDLSGDVIDQIIAGDQLFAVDQQQYLQGYLPIVFMYLQAINENTVGGGLPVLTGPGFVDASNAEAVQALAEAGTR